MLYDVNLWIITTYYYYVACWLSLYKLIYYIVMHCVDPNVIISIQFFLSIRISSIYVLLTCGNLLLPCKGSSYLSSSWPVSANAFLLLQPPVEKLCWGMRNLRIAMKELNKMRQNLTQAHSLPWNSSLDSSGNL